MIGDLQRDLCDLIRVGTSLHNINDTGGGSMPAGLVFKLFTDLPDDGRTNMISQRSLALTLAGMLLLATTGCGGGDLPEMGTVLGTVRYNIQLVPGAKVVFHHDSEEGGRMATGITDQDGEYELIYKEFPDPIYGAKAGPQIAYITTVLRADDPGGPAAETLPPCDQGKDSVLRAEVKPGGRECDPLGTRRQLRSVDSERLRPQLTVTVPDVFEAGSELVGWIFKLSVFRGDLCFDGRVENPSDGRERF